MKSILLLIEGGSIEYSEKICVSLEGSRLKTDRQKIHEILNSELLKNENKDFLILFGIKSFGAFSNLYNVFNALGFNKNDGQYLISTMNTNRIRLSRSQSIVSEVSDFDFVFIDLGSIEKTFDGLGKMKSSIEKKGFTTLWSSFVLIMKKE